MSKSESHILTDHKQIQKWVEERGGHPARVKGTGDDDDAGLLRIDFPDGKEDRLEEISWEQFFDKFDEMELGLLVQDHKASGEESYFNKLVKRHH